MKMDATGLTPEQYELLKRYYWPDEEDEEIEEDDFLAQLTTPEELHQLAWKYNWDDGAGIPDWIIKQPFCDRGTALLLFWRAAPGPCYYAYANREELSQTKTLLFDLDFYDLVQEIEEKYLSGFFSQQNIAFNPANDQGTDWIKENLDVKVKREIPAIMLEPTPGRVLERASF
ncbi:MAG: hypothetical protein BGO39_20485 [Chloroflexi bacterium 54-19]|nr:MAG: hypothetical protein BGO39_20485 [Chloroflexi bacterium 54-19]